jgi:outer membrane protein OmpA-like peptidoglycan-associated protein
MIQPTFMSRRAMIKVVLILRKERRRVVMKNYSGRSFFFSVVAAASLLTTQGCIATRDWVREQMDPLSGRVSQTESRLNKTETQLGSLDGRMGGAEGRLGQFEGKLGQVDAKTEKALNSLANLRLERRFVIDMKEGTNFAFNSSNLPASARKEIDGFLSDLKGDQAAMDNAVFLVAGHTDNVGSEDYNYELGRRRADAVSRYLVTQKNMDPLRVVSVSYGKSAPLTENNNAQGRAKNRRVEILIYREAISSDTNTASSQPKTKAPQQQSQQESQQQPQQLSQRPQQQ